MNFSDIRNRLYDEAERYWWLSLLLGFVVQLLAIASTVIKDQLFTVVTGVILFILPVAARWAQEKSQDDKSKGHKCRIAILYSDAFGKDIPSDIAREIRSWVESEKLSRAPFKRPYYDSKLAPSPRRLADIVSESAFWTYNLAKNMATFMGIYTGVYLISALTALYFLLQINLGTGVLIDSAKVIVLLISLVFTSEALLLIKQYDDLCAQAKHIYLVTAKLAYDKSLSTMDIMQIVEGYNILLVSSPPLPGLVYKIKQGSLNKAYKQAINNE